MMAIPRPAGEGRAPSSRSPARRPRRPPPPVRAPGERPRQPVRLRSSRSLRPPRPATSIARPPSHGVPRPRSGLPASTPAAPVRFRGVRPPDVAAAGRPPQHRVQPPDVADSTRTSRPPPGPRPAGGPPTSTSAPAPGPWRSRPPRPRPPSPRPTRGGQGGRPPASPPAGPRLGPPAPRRPGAAWPPAAAWSRPWTPSVRPSWPLNDVSFRFTSIRRPRGSAGTSRPRPNPLPSQPPRYPGSCTPQPFLWGLGRDLAA